MIKWPVPNATYRCKAYVSAYLGPGCYHFEEIIKGTLLLMTIIITTKEDDYMTRDREDDGNSAFKTV